MKLRSCLLIIIILIGGYFGLALVFSYLDSRSANSFSTNDDAIDKLAEQAMTEHTTQNGNQPTSTEESSETNSEPDATVNNSPPEESEPTPEPETSPEPDSESSPETDSPPADDPDTDPDESDGDADNDAERAAAEEAARRAAEEEAARQAAEEEAAREAAEQAAREAAAQAAEELFMNFYIHTGNSFNFEGTPKDVRWNKSTVYVQVVETTGNFSTQETQSLASYISNFNANSNYVKLQRRDSQAGDIVVEVFNREDTQFMCNGTGGDGCAIAHPNGNCIITSANVYITEENDTNGISTSYANYLVNHEMHHAMGYWHADEYYNSLMAVAQYNADYPNAVDLRAIRMLYNSGVSVCQNEAQTRAYFAEHPTP